MSNLETGVLIDLDQQPIYWHLPEGRSGGFIPDDRSFWEILWDNREKVWGFAHSHPGGGVQGPSYTDVTTFAAIEAGLGRRLFWPILTEDSLVISFWGGEDRLGYRISQVEKEKFVWVDRLWKESYGAKERGENHGS